MIPAARGLIVLGLLLSAGLAIDALGKRTRLPRVSLLVALGVIVGPLGFDLLTQEAQSWFPTISVVALVMVGFLIGGEFSFANIREHGRSVLVVVLAEATVTAAVVSLGLFAFGVDLEIALALGGIAIATDPAAVSGVVREEGAEGPFTERLLGVVATDDVVGMGVFSLLIAFGSFHSGDGGSMSALLMATREVVGGILLGGLLGLPVAYLSGRLRPGTPTLEEALGAVLLCAGLAVWLDVSFLLAAVVMGMVVANLARHHEQTFREIENIEWPFLVVFFVIAGASVDASALMAAGAIGVGYLALRAAGKGLGGWEGSRLIGAASRSRRWFGIALLPQAGVALGLALLASERFPEQGNILLSVSVAGTLVFELIGPILVRVALRRVGEAG